MTRRSVLQRCIVFMFTVLVALLSACAAIAGSQAARARDLLPGDPSPIPAPVLRKLDWVNTLKPKQQKWEPLRASISRNEVFASTARINTVAWVEGEIWLGTEGGLRVLSQSGRDKPLRPWQAALGGWQIQEMLVSGKDVYLLATSRLGPQVVVRAAVGCDSGSRLTLGEMQNLRFTTTAGNRLLGITGSGYVYVFDAHTSTGYEFATLDIMALSNWVNDVCSSSDGSLWVGAGGLARVYIGARKAWYWNAKTGLASDSVLSVLEEGNRLWIGTIAGLSRMNVHTGRIERYVGEKGVGGQPVQQIVRVGRRLFFRLPDKLAIFDTTRQKWSKQALPAGTQAGIFDNPPVETADRLFTHNGTLFGVFGKRSLLMVLDSCRRWHKVAGSRAGEIASNEVSSIVVLRGRTFFGTGAGLSEFDSSTRRFKTHSLHAWSERIVSMAVDGNTLWISSSGGLLHYDPLRRRVLSTMRTVHYSGKTDRLHGFEYLFVYKGFVYGIGEYSTEAVKIDVKTGKTSTAAVPGYDGIDYAVPYDQDGERYLIVTNRPNAMGETRRFHVALRLSDMTVQPLWENVPPNAGFAAALPGKGVWTGKSDRTGAYLTLVTMDGNVLARFPMPRSAQRSFSRHIAVGDDSTVWLSGDNDIWRLNPATGKWFHLLQEFTGVRGLVWTKGVLWVNTGNGVVRVLCTVANSTSADRYQDTTSAYQSLDR